MARTSKKKITNAPIIHRAGVKYIYACVLCGDKTVGTGMMKTKSCPVCGGEAILETTKEVA